MNTSKLIKGLKMYTYNGNNRATIIIDNNQHFILHSTSIVIKTPNSIILNSNGYNTNTTRKAMNEVGLMLGFKVYQKDYQWFVDYRGETLEYTDNMELK